MLTEIASSTGTDIPYAMQRFRQRKSPESAMWVMTFLNPTSALVNNGQGKNLSIRVKCASSDVTSTLVTITVRVYEFAAAYFLGSGLASGNVRISCSSRT